MAVSNYILRYSSSNNYARVKPIADLKTTGKLDLENMFRIINICIPIFLLLRSVLDLQDAIKRGFTVLNTLIKILKKILL